MIFIFLVKLKKNHKKKEKSKIKKKNEKKRTVFLIIGSVVITVFFGLNILLFIGKIEWISWYRIWWSYTEESIEDSAKILIDITSSKWNFYWIFLVLVILSFWFVMITYVWNEFKKYVKKHPK